MPREKRADKIARLEAEKAALQKEIAENQQSLENIPEIKKVQYYEECISNHEKTIESFGIFKAFKKKEIQMYRDKIEMLNYDLNIARSKRDFWVDIYTDRITKGNQRLAEIDAELAKYQ